MHNQKSTLREKSQLVVDIRKRGKKMSAYSNAYGAWLDFQQGKITEEEYERRERQEMEFARWEAEMDEYLAEKEYYGEDEEDEESEE